MKLKEWDVMKPHGKPVLVIVMDGVGESIEDEYNAVYMSNHPNYLKLKAVPNRFRTILAHGTAVGLPSDSDMGNSEVGHNALGAGRILKQGAALVDDAIASGRMFATPEWDYLIKPLVGTGRALHMVGLLSDGGVHSRFDQMEAMMRGAARSGVTRLRMHPLLDGRDVANGTSVEFMRKLESVCAELTAQGCDARVASGGGRMYVTMDRYEADWSMVQRGYYAHVLGEASRTFHGGLEAVNTFFKEDAKCSDQHMPAFVVVDAQGVPVGRVEDGDSVLNFNFRGDRAIEISRALTEVEFAPFDRKRFPAIHYAGVMQYDGDKKIPEHFLVSPPVIERSSGEYLAATGVRVFACSETQKFGHVTYFWNGNRSGFFDERLETYVETPSDNVVFNEKPAMKAEEIATLTADALRSGKYDMLRINFANGDMVGHTGDLAATITAMEAVDRCVGRLVDVVNEVGGIYLILADHGNADEMVQRDKKGKALKDEAGRVVPLTSHTLAPVPLFLGGSGLPANIGLVPKEELPEGGLTNVTATYINLLGYEAPADYSKSLLKVIA